MTEVKVIKEIKKVLNILLINNDKYITNKIITYLKHDKCDRLEDNCICCEMCEEIICECYVCEKCNRIVDNCTCCEVCEENTTNCICRYCRYCNEKQGNCDCHDCFHDGNCHCVDNYILF